MHSVTLTALSFFFFNDTATTEIYTLSLHDALPISSTGTLLYVQLDYFRVARDPGAIPRGAHQRPADSSQDGSKTDRKSTRLNSSHGYISYAVFCLKKKKNN